MLRASLTHNGRSITLYNEIYSEMKVGNNKVHAHFLNNLSKQIPPDCKVVIITDSGFVTPWFKAVLKLGWDYIGRLSTCINVRIKDTEEWIKTTRLDAEAKHHVKYIGDCQLGKSKTAVMGHIYTLKQKSKNRKDKSKYPKANKEYSKSAKQSWILATSLSNQDYNGLFIKNKYKNRMQIEQNFRDDKSQRFGFGWRLGRSKGFKRIAILCLIASIASFFIWCIGVLAEKLKLHRRFQVNSLKSKRIYLVYI